MARAAGKARGRYPVILLGEAGLGDIRSWIEETRRFAITAALAMRYPYGQLPGEGADAAKQ